jgi:hypothetical protein
MPISAFGAEEIKDHHYRHAISLGILKAYQQ